MKEVILLSCNLFTYVILAKVHFKNNFTIRYVPYVISMISYFAHTRFIFRGSFDVPDDPSAVAMSKDELFRHMI